MFLMAVTGISPLIAACPQLPGEELRVEVENRRGQRHSVQISVIRNDRTIIDSTVEVPRFETVSFEGPQWRRGRYRVTVTVDQENEETLNFESEPASGFNTLSIELAQDGSVDIEASEAA
jgi:hypothetical protein